MSTSIVLPLICTDGRYHLTEDLVIETPNSITGNNFDNVYIDLNKHKLTVKAPQSVVFNSIKNLTITNGVLDVGKVEFDFAFNNCGDVSFDDCNELTILDNGVKSFIIKNSSLVIKTCWNFINSAFTIKSDFVESRGLIELNNIDNFNFNNIIWCKSF